MLYSKYSLPMIFAGFTNHVTPRGIKLQGFAGMVRPTVSTPEAEWHAARAGRLASAS